MWNTIILLKGTLKTSPSYYKDFEHGDTIYGLNSEPEELARFSIDEKDKALKELSKHKCTYIKGAEIVYIEEYALQYCNCDEDGDLIDGSDYDLAENDWILES